MNKKICFLLGICLAAGSFSACGKVSRTEKKAWDVAGLVKEITTEAAMSSEEEEKQPQEPSANLEEEKQPQEPSIKQEAEQPQETLTESEEEKPQEPSCDVVSITISAAGDVTLGTHQQQDYWYSFRQEYDEADSAAYFLKNVQDIFAQDDMTLVNLEGPLTTATKAREGQIYSIKGEPEYVKILTEGSVEAVSMGNNHRLDYKEQGSEDTVQALTEEQIVYAYDELTGIYETKGIRIGFVSVNEVSWGSAVEKILQQGIEKLQAEGVDIILACCHWGVERDYYPEAYQRTLGQKCIDWGADLVIGHHPHVLQGIEEYQGKYILYSLGNFCFGANRNPTDKDTMIFQQTFTFENGVKTEDTQVRIIPCSISAVSSRNDFCPTPATGEEAKRIIERVNTFSQEYGVCFDEEGLLSSKGPR